MNSYCVLQVEKWRWFWRQHMVIDICSPTDDMTDMCSVVLSQEWCNNPQVCHEPSWSVLSGVEWFVTLIFVISMIHKHSFQCLDCFSENCLTHHPDKEQISKHFHPVLNAHNWQALDYSDSLNIVWYARWWCFYCRFYAGGVLIVQVQKENNQSRLPKIFGVMLTIDFFYTPVFTIKRSF